MRQRLENNGHFNVRGTLLALDDDNIRVLGWMDVE